MQLALPLCGMAAPLVGCSPAPLQATAAPPMEVEAFVPKERFDWLFNDRELIICCTADEEVAAAAAAAMPYSCGGCW